MNGVDEPGSTVCVAVGALRTSKARQVVDGCSLKMTAKWKGWTALRYIQERQRAVHVHTIFPRFTALRPKIQFMYTQSFRESQH